MSTNVLTDREKVYRGLLKPKSKLTNGQIRRRVLTGRFKSTQGGLKANQLKENKRGSVVSAKASAKAKSRYNGSAAQAWALATKEYMRKSGEKRFPKKGSAGHAAIRKLYLARLK
jgi:hypothetical protein